MEIAQFPGCSVDVFRARCTNWNCVANLRMNSGKSTGGTQAMPTPTPGSDTIPTPLLSGDTNGIPSETVYLVMSCAYGQ